MATFRFASTACTACHDDAHDGSLNAYLEPDDRDSGGCVSCHGLTAWRSISFDHDRSAYPLEGRHVDVACESCHPRQDGNLMRLSGVPTTCAGCHEDPHAGQFSRADQLDQDLPGHERPVIKCESCHTLLDWQPSLFDHNRDADYQLEGAHLDVPCAGCHPTEVSGDQTWVIYRPRPTECAGCHQGGIQ